MVKKQQPKRQRDIKSKLMAAICMLLVSTIMMVSSTYAWFTLSTAPEVTGITTSVGANGNLEMALLPESGLTSEINSQVGDSVKQANLRNVTWGNLVDVSDDLFYGLDDITLYPAQLSVENGIFDQATPLMTPTYGSDGRVSELLKNGITGTYDSGDEDFYPNNEFGVRAVGTASGMTPRQLDYRNARSAANTAMAQAKTVASQSLNNNGSALANVALKHGVANNNNDTYDQTDVASLRAIVNDLTGTKANEVDGVLEYIEEAYIQYILAYAASAASGTEDTVWTAVKGLVNAENATLSTILTGMHANAGSLTLPADLQTAITAFNGYDFNTWTAGTTGTVGNVAEASASLATMEAKGDNATFTWTEISVPLYKLADTNAMKINGYLVSQVKDNMSAIVNGVASTGLNVTIASGGGVYADIADHCGDFSASIVIKGVTYNGITLDEVNARMNTASTVTPPYLSVIGKAVEDAKAPASSSGTTMPISDFYGYIIDLAFRTNATDSNLMLQVDPTDRIYSDNTNDETMGAGSTMTFKATTTDFNDTQVKDLMSAIRIVFFNPDDGDIMANAKLDAAAATLGPDGWTAEIYLYTPGGDGSYTKASTPYTAGTTYYVKTITPAQYEAVAAGELNGYKDGATAGILYTRTGEGEPYTYAAVANNAEIDTAGTYYKQTAAAAEKYTEFSGDISTASDLYIVSNSDTRIADDDAVITALTQNVAAKVSVLVYLDGNHVDNGDVAATASTSMTGSMNLQFRSSATLVPMEYADLHIADGAGVKYNKVAGSAEFDATAVYYTKTPGQMTYTAVADETEMNSVYTAGSLYTKDAGADTYTKVSTTPTWAENTFYKGVQGEDTYAVASVTAETFDSLKSTLYVKA